MGRSVVASRRPAVTEGLGSWPASMALSLALSSALSVQLSQACVAWLSVIFRPTSLTSLPLGIISPLFDASYLLVPWPRKKKK